MSKLEFYSTFNIIWEFLFLLEKIGIKSAARKKDILGVTENYVVRMGENELL
jgi:hypothetical protein